MAYDEPGFEYEGTFYPFAMTQSMGDLVLVRQLTGLDGEEFATLLAEWAENTKQARDERVLVGLIGLSYWRKHPSLSMDSVARFVLQECDIRKVVWHGGAAKGDDVDPPTSAPELASVAPASDGANEPPNGASSDATSESPPATIPEVTGHPA